MDKPSAKVLIRNKSGFDETLWAYDLGNNVYRLANSPFFAYGVSYEDEIIAEARVEGEIPEFVRIHKKSGNRTIRITGDKKIERGSVGERVLEDLKAMGCTVEGAYKKYLCVNIPADVDLQLVVDYLIKYNQLWEYADPTFAEINKRKMNRRG